MEESKPSLLVLIVDTTSSCWAQQDNISAVTRLGFGDLLRTLAAFCNAYSLCHPRNKLVVLAAANGQNCELVFPASFNVRFTTSEGKLESGSSIMDDMTPKPHSLSKSIIDGLRRSLDNSTSSNSSNNEEYERGCMAQSMSRALCVLNKQLQKDSDLQGRILAVQIAKDVSRSYSSMMNSIFSAQKLGILVDALILSRESSSFFQQACLLTRGAYLHPPDQNSSLQLLLTHCLPGNACREAFRVPTQMSVDFRSSCVCHQKPVEFAFMCSVCLGIFCEPASRCLVCDTPCGRYDISKRPKIT